MLGYEFSLDELDEYQRQNKSSSLIKGKTQLNEDELDSVTGGHLCYCPAVGGGGREGPGVMGKAHWSITGKCNYKCKHCYM